MRTIPDAQATRPGWVAATLAGLLWVSAPLAQQYTVESERMADETTVFATVQSLNTVQARARISGTVADIRVTEGAVVEADEVIANVGDNKLALQIASIDSRISALQAERNQARIDLDRAEALLPSGAISQARLDGLRTALDVAENQLQSAIGERNVVRQQLGEGAVLAPVAGRILDVPVTAGTVIMPGEVVATIAQRDYVLRLELPERHAQFLYTGAPVRLAADETGDTPAPTGEIVRVYPEISGGRITADARVPGLGDYFVGQRVRVWIQTNEREAILVPAAYLTLRGGMDFVRLLTPDGTLEVPVQRGETRDEERVEILSGLRPGDQLVLP